ncbi:hypothetical protein [Sinorhizobium fredii]|uniref:hypothetical protein n=1 Tax=Rhizobium fredii TaxID=380 RepID=UPI003519027D
MDVGALNEFKKNIDFMDIMFRMSCASARLAFGAGLEQVDNDIEEGRYRLRAAILSQIKEFEKLLELVGERVLNAQRLDGNSLQDSNQRNLSMRDDRTGAVRCLPG